MDSEQTHEFKQSVDFIHKSYPSIDVTPYARTQACMIGNQAKWFIPASKLIIKAPFFYQHKFWKDYCVEAIASSVGRQLKFQVCDQGICEIRYYNQSFLGTYSYHFLPEEAKYLTYARIANYPWDKDYQHKFNTGSITDRIELLIDTVQKKCRLDISEYIWQMIVLDYLVANEDRHTSNLGVVQNYKTGQFETAMLFDFGLGLFETDIKYAELPYFSAKTLLPGKPFSTSLEDAFKTACRLYNRKPAGSVDITDLAFPSDMALQYFLEAAQTAGILVGGDPYIE